MTINVPECRTMLVKGFSGVTLDPGEHDRAEEIEQAFVDAGFATFVVEEKAHVTPENKMMDQVDNKEAKQTNKRKKNKK